MDRASRVIIRMRQKVVVPPVPTTPARWVVDPDFDLDYHLRRVALPAPGSLRQLLDLAEVTLQSPLDTSRALWEAVYVEGLERGRAALMIKLSHAITDGLGGLALFEQMYDTELEPAPRAMPPVPVPRDLSGGDLFRSSLRQWPATTLSASWKLLGSTVDTVGRLVRDPGPVVSEAIGFADSARRMLSSPPAEPSPLLRRRSLVTRTHVLELPLADLGAAAKAVGASVNDAYLAALCGGLGRYHEALGVPVDAVPLAIPVSLRTSDDPASGNRWTRVTLAAPIGESDPAERMKQIREQVIARRREPAIDVIGRLAPVLSLLPDEALQEVFDRITPPDIQASNAPGYAQETFLAGARVDRQYGLLPLPRVAMMAVLMSRAGTCTVTFRYDTASFTAADQLEKCLELGFDHVVELGRPRSRPAPRRYSREPAAGRSAPGVRDPAADVEPTNLMTATRPGAPSKKTTPSGQMRLPGSVAEVDASPEGPRIGAFFDLDGTLVAGFTVAAVTKDRLRRREVGTAEFLHMMQLALEYRLGRHQFETVIEGAVRSARGRLAEDVEEMGERVFRQSVANLIYPEMRELVRAHQRRGHTVVLSSSALTMQVMPVARYLGIDHVVCNRFVVDELAILTGDIERPVIWGTTKATSVQRFAVEHDVDLRSSYFYADGDEDLGLMHLVGNPRPVNPGPELSKVAARRGWPVLRLSSRDAGSPLGQVRA